MSRQWEAQLVLKILNHSLWRNLTDRRFVQSLCSKCFLWALYQMDTWDESQGLRKHSGWHAGLRKNNKMKIDSYLTSGHEVRIRVAKIKTVGSKTCFYLFFSCLCLPGCAACLVTKEKWRRSSTQQAGMRIKQLRFIRGRDFPTRHQLSRHTA